MGRGAGGAGRASAGSSLNTNRSGSYIGRAFRAVNATTPVKQTLGPATYFTTNRSAARGYGTDVRVYKVDLGRVLGTNSPEHDRLWGRAQAEQKPDESIAHTINRLARADGWNAIYGGEVFGLAIFDRNEAEEI